MRIQNKINHFLAGGLAAACIICIGVFTCLTVYLNRQNERTITELGNIYMSSMNGQISKHFESITEHRLVQLDALTRTVPPAYLTDETALREWVVYNARSRGYDAIACCRSDGTLVTLYGAPVEPSNTEALLRSVGQGRSSIAIGYNGTGEQVVLICVPISVNVPGAEDYVALVGALPVSYISEALSLGEDDSLIYSHVIRKNGSFVIRSSDAYRDNYFDRVRAVYESVDGKTPEEYIAELEAAMQAGKDYSAMVQMSGERLHMYCSALPNSVWYLVTLMPYGALNESVETLGTRSLGATLISCAVILLVLMGMFLRYFAMNRAQMKELEEARQAAENASRSKSEFLSNMSHDIRTPMNAIVGMTAIATANIDNPQQVTNCLKKITLSSRHLLGLINDVLDMSKIESGKMTLNVERVSLREVMDSIVNIVQPQVKAKNQQFNISIYNIMSENVRCDSVRLNQVMLNLLSNAIKFTPEGGSIEVVLHEEPSPKEGDFVRIRIHVKDSGIGMSQEYQ